MHACDSVCVCVRVCVCVQADTASLNKLSRVCADATCEMAANSTE